MTEKVILYKLPTGLVMECTFARCRLVHTSCLDRMTSSRLFRLARGVYRHVFVKLRFLKITHELLYIFHFHLKIWCSRSLWRPLVKEEGLVATRWHFLTLIQCARCRDKGVGQDPCVEKKPCEICATQPVEAPGALPATRPVEAPGAIGEFQPTSQDVRPQSTGPDQEELLDVDQELSAEQTYRETLCGVRSFIGWNQVPEFDSSSSAQDDNPFARTKSQQLGKVSVKVPVDDWLYRKFEKLNITVQEGYPSWASETAGLVKDQFVKPPRTLKWYDMFAEKKDFSRSKVSSWTNQPARLNSSFYCVNTSYPMDNSLSGRRRPARQMSEKDVLCLH